MLDLTQEDGQELVTDLKVAVNQVLVTAFHTNQFMHLEF